MNGREKPGEVVKRSPWKNRIIGSDIVDPKTLQPNELNWRKHPKPQAEALNGALDSIGWIQDIIVNKQTGRMIDGHLRVELALKNNETEVPVKYVDLSAEEEELALLTLDPIGAMAEADKNLLEALLNTVKTDDERINGLMDSIGQDYKIKKEVKEDDYEPPAEIETDIQRGDIYQLGRHRVMCGDSTSEEDVTALFNGKSPELMVTDPPYGVEYDPEWRADAGVNKNNKKMGAVLNDDKCDWSESWQLFNGDIAYIWHAGRRAKDVQISIESCGFSIISQIIWNKDKFALSRGDYHWKHEPCWYAVRDGKPHLWIGGRDKSTIWDIARSDDSGHGHGTQKPIDCMATPIRNHDCQSVYDPFLGSGTTLIACEQLDRICYGIEISPQYCEVICQRWEKLTGKQREKVSGVST